jgi:6-pyruvoyltetrahydropterin/6-carboxytetrahydropterin synthase
MFGAKENSLKSSLSRIYHFSAAHRLHSKQLREEENLLIYDKCNNINGHGHDYKLEVSIIGLPDKDTGMIVPLDDFDNNVCSVLKQLNYKYLDKEVEFFKQVVSTGENIIQYLWVELDKLFPKNMLYHLILWETNNNYFEFGRKLS